MFTGLSAFPLTPFTADGFDERLLRSIISRITAAGVDSIGALGSTGGFAYLSLEERKRIARVTIDHAGSIPVIVGVSALRTRDVLALAEDAQQAGAAAVLVSPMSYQPLTDAEVFGLFETVDSTLSVPLVVYDNPVTTGFAFSADLYTSVARLPNVRSIKVPAMPWEVSEAAASVAHYRSLLPNGVALGVSGDATAASGLLSGADLWFSVLGGVFPEECLALSRAALAGDGERTRALSARFEGIWELFTRYGSYRVVSAIAEDMGLTAPGMLPPPVQEIPPAGRAAVRAALDAAGFGKVPGPDRQARLT